MHSRCRRKFSALMNPRILFAVACFALLQYEAFAQDPAAKVASAQDIQAQAEALMEHARQLSDIRAPNAPPFQLKATFSFTGTNLEKVQGTYTEVWISGSQWRREIAANEWRRIEVATSTSIWRLDNANDFPEPASELHDLLDMFPPRTQSLVFEAVFDRSETTPPLECTSTGPDASHRESIFCFDQKSGVLLERAFPKPRHRNVVAYICDYGAFHKFGGFWSASDMICFEDRHRKIAAKVVDLSPVTSPDSALFTPPPGAIELGNCPLAPVKPHFESSPMPTLNSLLTHRAPGLTDPDRLSRFKVWFVVDIKGRPQYVRIVRPIPGHKDAEKWIVDQVRSWQYKPGTCNGVPMPMPVTVEFEN
jgi:hypothetical protein